MSLFNNSFHLLRPEWLWALLPALLLTLLLWRARGRSGSWSTVIAPELLPYLLGDQNTARRGKLLPVLLAWVLAVFAATGPSWRQIPQPIHQKQDALVLVLDLSYSMKAADLAPSRIDRARQKLLDLLERRREGVTGLIAYAGDAHIVTPLTDDNPTIANLLPALHPDMMPLPGSDTAAAIELALSLLQSAGIRDGRILLLTDGVRDTQLDRITRMLAGSGAELSVLGIGTATGAPIPLPRGGFLKDSEGTIVIPGLEEQVLQDLAALAGGRYRAMQIDERDLDQLLADRPLPGDGETRALDRTADTWEDQGYWFILALLPCALLLFRRGMLVSIALPLLLMARPEPAAAQDWDDLWLTPDQQGLRALRSGDPQQASALFDNQDWAAAAAYEGGDYETAATRFGSNTSADGWYNQGNALARAGRLEEAINAYRQSLELAPGRQDAEENLALLEQMKQQQDQQQAQDSQDGEQAGEQRQDQQSTGEGEQQSQDQQGEQSDQQQSSEQQNQQQSGEQQEPEQTGEPGEQEPADESSESGEQADQMPPEQNPDIEIPELAEDLERDQAMEQWLRRVPDDPSGLLREKFRYESRQRQRQGESERDDSYW